MTGISLRRGYTALQARLRGYQVVIDAVPSQAFLDALKELVAGDEAAHTVYRQLAEPTRVAKQHLLVLHRGEPALAVTLRRRADFWEPANANCAPHLRLPHRDGHLEGAFSAALLRIEIPEYFGSPDDFNAQRMTPFPVYVASLQEPHYSAHWSQKFQRNIEVLRRKLGEDVKIVIDDPTTIGWLISRWEENWRGHPSDEVGAADDLRAVLPGLLARGMITVVALKHHQEPVGAVASVLQGSTITPLVIARDKQWHNTESLGTMLLVESMETGRVAGLEYCDLGGYFDAYKSRLAPARGARHTVRFQPELPQWMERLRARLRKAPR